MTFKLQKFKSNADVLSEVLSEVYEYIEDVIEGLE
jgi:hypothetical protein